MIASMISGAVKQPRLARDELIRSTYRQVLAQPDLTDAEIAELRTALIRLAQIICEHIWGQSFY